ncbi:ATP synthase F0 subunit C [Campylobacter sp. JMF_01 NE2]|uniref:ATP synthase F0 subunit C n=1 Tax=unclassified Campylobacter TaxID=2593542 RepID=UPI001B7866F5|nr:MULTISPECIES: ATP synthase F0 subunit C [unclassified Campylobacter]MBP3223905.1 ATP synthase F0 subunit C [Campylobacter sp.]MDA3042898.1 ATP synthase F0 subunit C [Campylobacter sp. JMF_09 ED2]MDA3044267.1 ATP synthase F0 subunit C [Campylobacter sp. JMF_07 ED4]MDA3046236.1 ATP synthase F0 subunit C [Campylobacter sp. VBCF_06 NA8]MDA3048365.1 ATP synthase F0 subunit C [Campylobacter sp. JMF_08 NE1]
MKKVLVLLFALCGAAFAGEELSAYTQIVSYSAIAVGIVLGFAALGGAVGMGNAANATILGIARNPSVASKLSTTMYISLAMIEAQVIYALVIAFILLFANPFVTDALTKAAA